MIGRTLPARMGDEVARAVRALGSHRYVGGRLHLVHAFVLDALDAAIADPAAREELRDAIAWARATLRDQTIDRASRDERLWRRATEREVAAALGAFWGGGDVAAAARAALERHLATIDVHAPSDVPFDEGAEEELFPVLIDAGWELLPLARLDPERHKGAIDAIVADADDPLAFAAARFDEESLGAPPAYLQELPAIGPVELLRGAPNGVLAEPLVVWTEGPEAYHAYVLRGVARAAKLPDEPNDA